MAVLQLGPRLSHVLVFFTGCFSVAILSYDASMINNLNINARYLEYFGLTSSLIGLNAAIISAGAVVTGPFLGSFIDRVGRKKGMAVGNLLVVLGVVIQASSQGLPQFIVGRFFVGVATTVAGTVAPMWITEIGSPKYRQLISGLVMTAVPFTAVLVCFIILGIYDADSDWAWRGIVLGEAVGPIFALFLLPFVDESPRWLIAKGRVDEARDIIIRLHTDGKSNNMLVDSEITEIVETIEYDKIHGGGWKDLVTPAPNRRRFLLAVLTNIFYQIVGANMVLYFSSFVIISAGIVKTRTTLLVNMGLLFWNFFMSLLGAFSIYRFGRRISLIVGTSGSILCLSLMAILVYFSQSTGEIRYGIGAIIVVAAFLFFTSTSWMILAYTYPPELLKYSQRANGVAIAQSIGFCFSFLNLYTAPIALTRITWKYYAINAGWDVVILVVIVWLFVETKGKTLEQMDELFKHVSPKRAGTLEVLNGESLARKLTTESASQNQITSTKLGLVQVKDAEVDEDANNSARRRCD